MPPRTRSKSQQQGGATQPTSQTNTSGEATAAARSESKETKPAAKRKDKKPQANTARKRKSASSSDQQQNTSSAKRLKSSKNEQQPGEGGNAPPGKIGSKHMDATPPAPAGSASRLPKKGQSIVWKAMPGYVDGVVEEVLTKGKTVDGKAVKASKDDPKIVLKSNASGKICVHKPEVCFFD